MEVKILEEKKNKIIFEIEDETHTLPQMLKEQLWEDDHVKAAGYTQEHPLIPKTKFVLETDGADPKKTIESAIKKMQKQVEKIKDEIKKIKA